MSYVLQREALSSRALTEMTLAPYAKDPGSVTTPEVAVAEFDAWLNEQPEVLDRPWEEIELSDLLFLGR